MSRKQHTSIGAASHHEGHATTSSGERAARVVGTAPGRAAARRTMQRIGLVLAGVLAVVGLGTPSASAASYGYSAGSPGHLWVSPVVGRGHFTGSGAVVPGLRVDSATFGRSPATRGQQTVWHQHYVYEWVTGVGWQQRQSSPWVSGVVPAGQASSYTLPWIVSASGQATGHFQVSTTFLWFDSATNQHLGTRIVAWDQPGDYRCEASRFVSCLTGTHWVRVL